MTEVQTVETEASEFMTPDELELLKKLQAKRKAQVSQMGAVKETLFQNLTKTFGSIISKCKKDLVTVSSPVMEDGNIYAVTFGIEDETKSEVNTEELAKSIIEAHLATIEPIMGIGSSTKISGTYEGKKLFWQIRKRQA